MTVPRAVLSSLLGGIVLITGCKKGEPMNTAELSASISQYAPTVIGADTSKLSPGDKAALRKLVAATEIMDRLYLRQAWSGNEALLQQLETDTTQNGRLKLHNYRLEMGPWSSLGHDSAFIAGVPTRPVGANFYPPDMTKEEFETWTRALTEFDREKATGFFYTIRRNDTRTLCAIPYSEEYRDLLAPAAALLREAAALTDNPSLKKFLELRADAFQSNDYYASDVAWMNLDSPIDVTIGPYETYMDGLFNYKAAFEAFVGLRDDEATAKLAFFAGRLQEIENNLPIDPKYRNPKLGAMAPIRVIDEIVVGGEARGGVQTAAFNLPNDERIVKEMGSKRVMLKNVQEAKFKQILLPIAAITIDSAQRANVDFDPFFTHILAHELMHGLGPHAIIVKGESTTVRQELKELSSAWEEAKADIAGLFALQYLIDRRDLPRELEQKMYVTYLVGAFRSVRFGINEAHGKGVALQFNFLMDMGGIVYDPQTEHFSINILKMKEAVRTLTGIIMTVQAQGDYAAAAQMFGQYAIVRPPMQKVLDKMSNIPVDIAPEFPLAK